MAIDAKIYVQVAMVGFGTALENYFKVCVTSSAQADDPSAGCHLCRSSSVTCATCTMASDANEFGSLEAGSIHELGPHLYLPQGTEDGCQAWKT